MTDNESRKWNSEEWCVHFQNNLELQRIDWQRLPVLDRKTDWKLIRSLQAWQLGETSDGSHLLKAAKKYAARIQDPQYLSAIEFFILEEQKHGRNLGKYLDAIGAHRLNFDLGDWLFRRVRYFNSSIEIWTVSVIIVEMFAQLYYSSLSKAAGCPLLTEICNDILADESHHIRFQAERLQEIVSARSRQVHWFSQIWYQVLFCTITLSVWIGHGYVFRRAGLDFRRFCQKSQRRFSRILAGLDPVDESTAVEANPV